MLQGSQEDHAWHGKGRRSATRSAVFTIQNDDLTMDVLSNEVQTLMRSLFVPFHKTSETDFSPD